MNHRLLTILSLCLIATWMNASGTTVNFSGAISAGIKLADNTGALIPGGSGAVVTAGRIDGGTFIALGATTGSIGNSATALLDGVWNGGTSNNSPEANAFNGQQVAVQVMLSATEFAVLTTSGVFLPNGSGVGDTSSLDLETITGFDPALSAVGTSFAGGLLIIGGWGYPAEYYLDLEAIENGSVTGNESPYEPDSTATLTAVPDSGYLFIGWVGDASGTDNPLSVLMDTNKAIGATFEPDLADDDGDGLTNYQEEAIYGTNPDLEDTDEDGLTDAYEVGIGRYTLVLAGLTWAQASDDAETRGGYLGTFTSEEEWNIALTSLGPNALDGVTGAWIGATDAEVEGDWTWITGEPFTFDVWATGQPDNFNNSDVAEVAGGFGATIGKWFDTGVSVLRDAYILEIDYSTDPTVADGDGDGLNDGEEQAAGSNPFLADTDSDGLTDGQEVNLTLTDPSKEDSDGNGTLDGVEDLDDDGLDNLAEVNVHKTDPRDADSDNDGVTDGDEVNYVGSTISLVEGSFTWAQATEDAATRGGRVAAFPEPADYVYQTSKIRGQTGAYLWIGLSDEGAEGTWVWNDGSPLDYDFWFAGQPDGGVGENHVVILENLTNWADSQDDFAAGGYVFEFVGLDPNHQDSDRDGLTDGREVNTVGSNPVDADTDRDGLTDGAEVDTHGSSPTNGDTDDDGLTDYVEVTVHGSDPTLKDSDGDGFDDKFEVDTGFDPTSDTSTPDSMSSTHMAAEFRFIAANGATYRIESSFDLEDWTIIEDGIAGTGGVIRRFYSIEGETGRYFRAIRN